MRGLTSTIIAPLHVGSCLEFWDSLQALTIVEYLHNFIFMLLSWSIWYSFWWSFLQVGLSTGQSGSGLCPTWNRPDGIGFEKTHLPPTTGVNELGGSDFNGCSDGSVGVKNMRKWRKTARKQREKPRSGENLIGIYEISSNPALISSDSMRFC